MWELLRRRLSRPDGRVNIIYGVGKYIETVNVGAGLAVMSPVPVGSNTVPVRLWSSLYILLSVGLCRVLSGAVGTSRELLSWAVVRAALVGAGALVFSPRELIRGPGLGSGRSGRPAVWGSGGPALRASRAPRKRGHQRGAVGSSGLLWALVVA